MLGSYESSPMGMEEELQEGVDSMRPKRYNQLAEQGPHEPHRNSGKHDEDM